MRILMVAVTAVLLGGQVLAASDEEVEAFSAKIDKPLRSARYMEGKCVFESIPGWEGFNTMKCSYTVKDQKTGNEKTGLVAMLNPTPKLLAIWILNACESVRPTENRGSCASRVFRQVLSQSGGQFPVAGIVYEDLIPRDGVFEAYGFASGVTAILKGVQHRRIAAFSDEELAAALVAEPIQTVTTSAFARVIGVTRAQYLKANPAAPVSGIIWLSVVKEEHKKAMGSSRNSLIDAWVSANAP